MTSTDGQTKLLDDYEDYWERSLSLRVMENQTLREQLEERAKEFGNISGINNRNKRILRVLACVILLLAFELTFPGTITEYITAVSFNVNDVVSHGIAMLIVWWMYC